MIKSCFRESCPNWAKTTIQQANQSHSLERIVLPLLGSRGSMDRMRGQLGTKDAAAGLLCGEGQLAIKGSQRCL